MGTLDVLHVIEKNRLNPKYYFQSLIEQSCSCGLLSEYELSNIQSDLLLLLAKQTDRWSLGKSSSIPIEKAQDMLTSIMFVIGICLKSYQTPEQAVEVLKSKSLNTLFDKGFKKIQQKIVIAQLLQKNIVDNLLDTSNIYYHSTIVDGINGFFKLYCPQFAADKNHITADYPTFLERPELDGIEFIEGYLRYIEAENAFCIQFAPPDIHHLLCGLTGDYTGIPLNIFEPVCLSAMGLIMLGRDPKQLNLSKDDVLHLYEFFFDKSKEEIENSLKKALFLLDGEIAIKQTSKQYISLSIPKFSVIIEKAVTTNTLDKIFLVPAYPEQERRITFSYGETMNDLEYKKLVEKVLQSDDSREKVEIILKEVHSFGDLLDILSDGEFCLEEFELLISLLPLSVLAILLSQYSNGDFLERESEQFLFAALKKRECNLLGEEKKKIERVLSSFQKGKYGIDCFKKP